MSSQPPPGAPALASDRRRSLTALAVALPSGAVTFTAYILVNPVRLTVNTATLTAFIFWIAYAAVWLTLTHRVFAPADSSTLRAWLQASATRTGRLPTVNIQASLLATAAVALDLFLPGLVTSNLANGLTVVVVLSAWLVTVSTYAVHYARLDGAGDAFELPGPASPVFTDYYYLAAQIATTFSSSDINVLTTRARAAVTGQAFIGFAFSTFIIALLIAILFP